MDKAITTVLLTIAGVVSVLVIMNALYPAIGRGTGILAGMIRIRILTRTAGTPLIVL